jgi:mannose-6-phosphate isomerase-like protein (cupin superfamily)
MASNYAVTNFDDVDQTGKDGLDGRFTRSRLGSEQTGVSRWRYDPGFQTPGHHHEIQEETYAVISGSGRMKIGDEIIELKQWDVVRVAPTVPRGFEAGPEGLELISVGGTRPDDGDGSLVEDHWAES